MTAINLQIFGTPKAVYQSSNINQLSPELENIAYQESDSLLAGYNVSSTYTNQPITVALNYGITGNQSDKLSSGYLPNILAQHSANILAQCSAKLFAQQPAKVLADESAKIYANQSPKFTENQSGEYFLGQSAKHFANLKRGEFTPFAKGDFSHLSKEANYLHWQDLIVVTTRGRIEFLQSIKGKIIEFLESIKKERIEFLDTIKNEQIEFCQPIKKGSFVKCAIHHLRLWVIVGYSKNALAKSSVGFRSLNILKVTHDAPCVFFCVCAYAHLQFAVLYRSNSMVMLAGQPKGWLVSFSTSTANPVSVTTPIEIRRSGGDSLDKLKEIIVMMATPTQTQFKFLFLSIKRSDTTAKPCRIAVTALNEHDARLMLVRDYILSFAGRLPVIGGKHHA